MTVPPVEPSGGADAPPPTIPAGRGIIDTRIGKPPVFSSDESTWGDWSFKFRSSYVSVVDFQLGRMMEAAELAAHANVWIPSEPLFQYMDAQLTFLLVMLTSGVQAFRDLARRYNPRSQARSLAQLQEIMHFDFGKEPAGVTDRMIVFERLVGEYKTSNGEASGCTSQMRRASGESSTGTQDTPVAHLWFTTRPRHHEAESVKLLSGKTVMAATPFNDNGEKRQWKSTLCMETKARKANTPRARKARTRAKESTRVNTRAVLSLKAIAVTAESGDTSKKTVDTRTLLPKWMRRNLSNLHTAARAAARHETHHHLLVCFQLELRSPRRKRSPR